MQATVPVKIADLSVCLSKHLQFIRGKAAGCAKKLTSGSKALGVLKTVPRNLKGTPWLHFDGAREADVTAGVRCCETRRETFHLHFVVALATT